MSRRMSRELLSFLAVLLSTAAGCAPKMQKPLAVCPGKLSTADALAVLRSNVQKAVPFRASGQCLLKYYVEGKNKPQSESLDVKLWANPPMEVYFQGEKALIGKAVVLGSNDREFWLAISPKEISLYCWGLWAEQDSPEGPAINPGTLLESLGIGQAGTGEGWSLSNEGAFDILTKRERGAITRKMYVYSCDYRVRKIEFFGADGRVAARAELDDYQEVANGFFVPAVIKIATQGRDRRQDALNVTLNPDSIKRAEITEARRKALFDLPSQKGFANVRRIVNGKLVPATP